MLASIDIFSVLSKTGQFVLCLSILVVLHELGHFIPAKLFKCRVDKFYLFFDPWFSLFKKKYKDTEYGIGWLPLGGYVKIAGMVDESLDLKKLSTEISEFEFRGKPAWQRFIIMIGGVTVNLLLAIFIFIFLNLYYGKDYISVKELPHGISETENAKFIGLKLKDRLIKIDGSLSTDIDDWEKILHQSIDHTIELERNGKIVNLKISADQISHLPNKNELILIPSFPVIIDSVTPETKFSINSPQFRKADQIICINNVYIRDNYEYSRWIKKYSNTFVNLKVLRKNTDTLTVTVYADKYSKLKIFQLFEGSFIQLKNEKLSFLHSVTNGVKNCYTTLALNIRGFKEIISGKRNPNESVGSLISIGNLFPRALDWRKFWTLTAILSIILAFMNILPIPALDGGHALILLVEIITGKKPSLKFLEISQIIGMILLFALMIYALGLDILRLFR